MPLVTIISDWCKGDYYLASLKGRIMSLSDSIVLVDISSSIPPFEVLQESFVLRHSYSFFPKGTIHLMCVASELPLGVSMIIVYADGYYFIGPNDGRFSHLFDQPPSIAYEIQLPALLPGTFNAPYYFEEGVRIILENSFLEKTKVCEIKEEVVTGVVYDTNTIVGRVVYIDSFGNVITNISKKIFEKVHKGRHFTIFVNGPLTKINDISFSYGNALSGELIALFNSLDLLEISICNGNAASIETLSISSEVRIKFEQ